MNIRNYLKLNITYNMEHKTIVYNKTNKSTFVLDNIQKDIVVFVGRDHISGLIEFE